MGEVRRDRDHRQPGQACGVLGHVERPPAPDSHDRVVGSRPQRVGEVERRLDRSTFHGVDLRILEGRLNHGHDLFALPWSDNDGNMAVRRDPAIAQKRPERGDRPAPDFHGERAGNHAG